jgi:hypothetical protein
MKTIKLKTTILAAVLIAILSVAAAPLLIRQTTGASPDAVSAATIRVTQAPVKTAATPVPAASAILSGNASIIIVPIVIALGAVIALFLVIRKKSV